jgi:methylmalonyl-CoA mutase cobalamin-binding subunit
VHVVGVSSLAAGHLALVPEVFGPGTVIAKAATELLATLSTELLG